MATVKPLIVIVGPTASGKSSVAHALSLKLGGEIIAADSRTVYKGLDIGTAKPSIQDQNEVPYHLLNILKPDKIFSAAEFKQRATVVIDEIRKKDKVPIMVGGTGLYVDGVVFDYQFVDQKSNEDYSAYSVTELKSMIKKQRITLPQNSENPRHLIGTLRRGNVQSTRRENPIPDSIIVGITSEKSELEDRIRARATVMFENGVVDEAIVAAEKYGWDAPGLSGNIYQIIRQLQADELTRDQAIEQFAVLDRQLAKRQRTWFSRNPYIKWLELGEVESYILTQMDRAAS